MAETGAGKKPQARSFNGAPLAVAARLDARCPGHLLHVLYASDARRQAIFASYSALDLDHLDPAIARLTEVAPEVAAASTGLDPAARLARALQVLDVKQIITIAFGSAPNGLPGLLARLGADPLDPATLDRKSVV